MLLMAIRSDRSWIMANRKLFESEGSLWEAATSLSTCLCSRVRGQVECRVDDTVRSWKSTDRSENRLAGSHDWISGVWLNPYSVVYCSAEALFATKVFFSSLHGHMPQ
jgi:hypothetical protein